MAREGLFFTITHSLTEISFSPPFYLSRYHAIYYGMLNLLKIENNLPSSLGKKNEN